MLSITLDKIMRREDLDRNTARLAMGEIMDGKATPAQIGAFLAGLRVKGEQVEEIIGFAQAMRERSLQLPLEIDGLVDTCGTGGDGSDTFNISTAAAMVAASGGVKIAKHGNRAVSSKSGSADVLEALGVPILLTPENAADCLKNTNLCFLFAPLYHQAMKHAAGPRKELAVRTVFNLLGPLTNPAKAHYQLLGVYDVSLIKTVAEALRELHVKRALVVAGEDGLDELTVTGKSRVAELKDGVITTYEIEPEQFGLSRYSLEELKGGDAQDNSRIIYEVYEGKSGAARDITVLNAGAILYLAGRATTIAEGVRQAKVLIDSGQVLMKLKEIQRVAGGLYNAS
ncbi:anthranilate phosphoribosyltransferase [Brevibacillus ginsengisoli]|uniref:anthranilate phosphoribosyltransferase n=1 Tax=Brevibacillus ginsengisoli TaxID=363854 RepID=UPI003CF1F279